MGFLPFRDAPLEGLCKEIDDWRIRLDYRGPIRRTWAGRLRRELEAEAIAASTSMEGVPVTVEEVRRILAGQPPAEVAREDRELVEGYREAMSFVLRRADDPAFAWNRELVIGLHDRVLAGNHALAAGRLRTQEPTSVVNSATGELVFVPPAGDQVPGLIDEACKQMQERPAHPALQAAWIHLTIAAIHPFRDGNGRAARVSASLAMYRGGFKRPEFTSLEEWWGRHLDDYYASFACLGKEFDPEADVTPFVVSHLEAQLHQVRALDNREKVERQIWSVLEEMAEDANLAPRAANALWEAFFSRQVTAGYYRALADVSPATATKDLAALVSARLLESRGLRRGRSYLATDRLYKLAGQALGIPVSPPADVSKASIVAELSRRIKL